MNKSKRQLSQAKKLLKKKNWNEAIALLSDLLNDPDLDQRPFEK
jgi:hypothetical protein